MSGGSSAAEEFTGHYVVLAVFFFAIVGIVVRLIQRHHLITKFTSKLPYTVILLVLGGLLGLMYEEIDLGELTTAFEFIADLHPDIILFVFIPALIFESAYGVNVHTFGKIFDQALLLAGPGVVINICIMAVVAHEAFGYDWSWDLSFLLGSILAATDPVAVVALLRELGASPRLATVIEGESLLNDGTAFVAFLLFQGQIDGANRDAGEFIKFFFRLAIGGPLMGAAFALGGLILLELSFFDNIVEAATTITIPYLAFWVSEGTSAHVSGVLAVVVVGLVFSWQGQLFFSSLENGERIHHAWHLLSWFANTLLFLISGFIIVVRVFYPEDTGDEIDGRDVANVFILYAVMNGARFFANGLMYPILQRTGYGMDLSTYLIMSWGGLRGAIALALALLVELDENINEFNRSRVSFLVACIVAMTLLINGTTVKYILQGFDLDRISRSRQIVVDKTVSHLVSEAEYELDRLKQERFYQGANWNIVEERIQLGKLGVHRKIRKRDAKITCEVSDTMRNIEARKIFLNAMKREVRAAFYNEGSMGQLAFRVLDHHVEELLDKDNMTGIDDIWADLEPQIKHQSFVKFYKKCRSTPVVASLLRKGLMQYAQTGFEVCLNFIEIVRQVMEIMSEVIGHQENIEAEYRKSAHKAVSDCEIQLAAFSKFSNTLTMALQSRHAAFRILEKLLKEIEEVQEAGLLDESEADMLTTQIHTIMAEAKYYRQYTRFMTPKEVLEEVPFIERLCDEDKEVLCRLTSKVELVADGKDAMVGQNPSDFIYVVMRGIVRCTYQEYGLTEKRRASIAALVETNTFIACDSSTSVGEKVLSAGAGYVYGLTSHLMSPGLGEQCIAESLVEVLKLKIAQLEELLSRNAEAEVELWRLVADRVMRQHLSTTFIDMLGLEGTRQIRAALLDCGLVKGQGDGQRVVMDDPGLLVRGSIQVHYIEPDTKKDLTKTLTAPAVVYKGMCILDDDTNVRIVVMDCDLPSMEPPPKPKMTFKAAARLVIASSRAKALLRHGHGDRGQGPLRSTMRSTENLSVRNNFPSQRRSSAARVAQVMRSSNLMDGEDEKTEMGDMRPNPPKKIDILEPAYEDPESGSHGQSSSSKNSDHGDEVRPSLRDSQAELVDKTEQAYQD
eukprot:Clim_evm144s157 gene=Clim_evmTU144s157